MHNLFFVFAVLCLANILSDPQDIHLHILSEDTVQNKHDHETEHKHAVQTQTQSQTQSQKKSNRPSPVKTVSGYAQKQTYLAKKTRTGVYTQKQMYLAKKDGIRAVQTQTQKRSNRLTPVKTAAGFAQKQTYSHTEVKKCKFSPECPRRSRYENPLWVTHVLQSILPLHYIAYSHYKVYSHLK